MAGEARCGKTEPGEKQIPHPKKRGVRDDTAVAGKAPRGKTEPRGKSRSLTPKNVGFGMTTFGAWIKT